MLVVMPALLQAASPRNPAIPDLTKVL